MGFLNWLLRVPPQTASLGSGRTEAQRIMRGLNRHVLCGQDGGEMVFIEDHSDPDGRMYRLEYRTDPGGTQATAWCRYKPWPNKYYKIRECHLFGSGEVCLGNRAYNLHDAVKRARYWASAYSYLREHGSWPD